MAINITANDPVFISSDFIDVFPCAGRTVGAAKYTSEYNLTHLGIPDTSWIVGVTDSSGNKKSSGDDMEADDRVSLVINGYFFEFTVPSLSPSVTWTSIYASILLNKMTGNNADAVQMQWKLTPITITGKGVESSITELPEDFDQSRIFRGMVLSKDNYLGLDRDESDPPLTVKSLQLADESGKYLNVGRLPLQLTGGVEADSVGTNQLKDGAVTEDKISANAVATGNIQSKAVTTAKLAGKAVTAAKLGDVVDDTVDKLKDEDTTDRLGVNLTGGNGSPISAVLSGKVQTKDIANEAVKAAKLNDDVIYTEDNKLVPDNTGGLGVKLTRGANEEIKAQLTGKVTTDDIADNAITVDKLKIEKNKDGANGIEVILSEGPNGGLVVGVTADTVGGVDVANIANHLSQSGIDTDESTLPAVTGDAESKPSLGVKLGGGATKSEPNKPITVELTGGVATENIYNGAITKDKIAAGAVGTDQLAKDAVTAAKLGDVVNTTISNISADATGNLGVRLTGGNGAAIKAELTGKVQKNDIANNAVTKDKLGAIVSSTGDKLGDNTDNKLEVKLTGGNGSPIGVELSGAVGTDDIADDAVTAAKLGNIIAGDGTADHNGVTVTLQQNENGALVIGVKNNISISGGVIQSALQAIHANYLDQDGINTDNKQLATDIEGEDENRKSLGVQLGGGYTSDGADNNEITAQLTGGVDTKNIYNSAITEDKIANDAVTTDKIASKAVDATRIAYQTSTQYLVAGNTMGLGVQLSEQTSADGNSKLLKASLVGSITAADLGDVVDTEINKLHPDKTDTLGVELTRDPDTNKIEAKLSGKVGESDLARLAVNTNQIAYGAVDATRIAYQTDAQYLNNDDSGLGVQLSADDANSLLKASLVGSVTTGDIADQAVDESKISSSICNIDPQYATNEDGLYVYLYGGGGSQLTAQLGGHVNTHDIEDYAVTANKLGDIISHPKGSANGMQVTLSQTDSKGGLIIGLSGDKVNKAGTADVANTIKIGDTAYTVGLSGNTLTLTSAG